MIYTLMILLATTGTFGLIFLISPKTIQRPFWSLSVGFLGSSLLPYTLHRSLGINLRTASSVGACIFFIATAVALFRIWRNRGDVFLKKEFLLFLGVGIFAVMLLVPFVNYTPHKWDEFSHWMTLPKQMANMNQLILRDLPSTWTQNYTTGWTLLNAFPDLALNRPFHGSNSWILGFLLGLLTLLAIGESLERYQSKFQGNSHSLFWIAFASLIYLYGPVFSSSLLIDAPQTSAIILLFILVLDLLQEEEWTSQHYFCFSLISIVGYSLKKSFVILPVLTALYLGWILYRTKKTKKLNALLALLISLVPFSIYAWDWKNASQGVSLLWNSKTLVAGILNVHFSEFLELIKNFSIEFFIMFKSNIVRNIMIVIAIFLVYKKNFDDQIKKLLSLYWFYFFVFISGLIWIYLTGFAIYERDHLASFQRYMFYAIHPLRVIGFFVVVNYLNQVAPSWLARLYKHSFIFTLIFVLVPFIQSANTVLKVKPKWPVVESQKLVDQLLESPANPLRLQIIDQKSNGENYYQTYYNMVGWNKLAYQLNLGFAFSNSPTTPFQQKVDWPMMDQKLVLSDLIWVISDDDFIREWLDKNQIQCPKLVPYSIIPVDKTHFTCSPGLVSRHNAI